jgi:hypothetical protein
MKIRPVGTVLRGWAGGRTDIKLIQSLFPTCEGYAAWPSQRIGVTRTAGQSGISRYTAAGPNSTKQTWRASINATRFRCLSIATTVIIHRFMYYSAGEQHENQLTLQTAAFWVQTPCSMVGGDTQDLNLHRHEKLSLLINYSINYTQRSPSW